MRLQRRSVFSLRPLDTQGVAFPSLSRNKETGRETEWRDDAKTLTKEGAGVGRGEKTNNKKIRKGASLNVRLDARQSGGFTLQSIAAGIIHTVEVASFALSNTNGRESQCFPSLTMAWQRHEKRKMRNMEKQIHLQHWTLKKKRLSIYKIKKNCAHILFKLT